MGIAWDDKDRRRDWGDEIPPIRRTGVDSRDT